MVVEAAEGWLVGWLAGWQVEPLPLPPILSCFFGIILLLVTQLCLLARKKEFSASSFLDDLQTSYVA